jgi:hypothetical protein
MRLAAQEVVRSQERVCEEKYAADKDMVRLQSQVRTQWFLISGLVLSVLALAWGIVQGVFTP